MPSLLARSLPCVLLVLLACSPDRPEIAATSTAPPQVPPLPPRIDYDAIPWISLHPESLRGTPEDRIFHQHPTAKRPELLTRKEPAFSATDRLRPGIWIVESVIGKDGRIARFRILKGPTTNEETVRVLTDALREWRFQPATVEGEPIAVFYTLTVRVEPASRKS